jgi:V-type H+-transporting ATPase subunit F
MARRGKQVRVSESQQLIGIIGDEETVTGFLLTGIGERNIKGETNFFIVDEHTTAQEIEDAFVRLIQRPDIAVLLINQHIADAEIRHLVNNHDAIIPTILEIPSKDHPYSA